jgi:large conductance mechanosensitive channel
VLGEVNFSGLFINLTGRHYTTLEQAKAAGAPTINYGAFNTPLLDFLIVALYLGSGGGQISWILSRGKR